MRVVLDVNVWISGLLWGGVPGQMLRLDGIPILTPQNFFSLYFPE
jgi:hypothetical protein